MLNGRMLPYNSHLLKQTDKRKRLWRLGSQAAWAPVNSVLQHPPKQLTDASALFITVAILTAAPPVHGVVDGAYASSRQTEVVQTQACEVSSSSVCCLNPLAELSAGLFGDIPDERDPITPFTLYGTTFKKYLIEQLQGEKILSRRKGFTVDACVGAVEVTQETPQFQGLPSGDQALYSKNRVCRKSEGQDLKETCRSACEAACGEVLDSYGQQLTQESGFAMLASDKARMARSCSRNCTYECSKPGKAFDFIIPYRR